MSEAKPTTERDTDRKLDRSFRGLGRDFLLYGIMDAFSRLVGFLLLPVFTRVFSPEEYGILDLVVTLTSLTGLFAGLALTTAITRYFHEVENEGERADLVVSILCLVCTTAAILLLTGFFLAGWLADLLLGTSAHASVLRIAFISVVFTAASVVLETAIRMERKVVRFNLVQMVHSTAYVAIAMFMVFVAGRGVIGVVEASAVAALLKLVTASFWTRRYLRCRPRFRFLKRSLRYSLPLLPAVLVTWINRQADRLILVWVLGLAAVGIFGAAAKIAMIVNLLATVFKRSWGPFAMTLLKAPEDERNAFYRKVLTYLAGVFAILGLLFTAVSPELFRLLVPQEYWSGVVVIPWLIAARVVHVAANVTVMGVLISENTWINSLAAWIGASLNIGLAWILIPRFGIGGAAVGGFVAELVFAGILLFFSERFSNMRFEHLRLLGVLSIYVAACWALVRVSTAVESPWSFIALRAGICVLAITLVARVSMDRNALFLLGDLARSAGLHRVSAALTGARNSS